jgi:hypothetical protein
MGMTTMCDIMAKMSRGIVNVNDAVSKAVTDKFITVASFLDRILIGFDFDLHLGSIGRYSGQVESLFRIE